MQDVRCQSPVVYGNDELENALLRIDNKGERDVLYRWPNPSKIKVDGSGEKVYYWQESNGDFGHWDLTNNTLNRARIFEKSLDATWDLADSTLFFTDGFSLFKTGLEFENIDTLQKWNPGNHRLALDDESNQLIVFLDYGVDNQIGIYDYEGNLIELKPWLGSRFLDVKQIHIEDGQLIVLTNAPSGLFSYDLITDSLLQLSNEYILSCDVDSESGRIIYTSLGRDTLYIKSIELATSKIDVVNVISTPDFLIWDPVSYHSESKSLFHIQSNFYVRSLSLTDSIISYLQSNPLTQINSIFYKQEKDQLIWDRTWFENGKSKYELCILDDSIFIRRETLDFVKPDFGINHVMIDTFRDEVLVVTNDSIIGFNMDGQRLFSRVFSIDKGALTMRADFQNEHIYALYRLEKVIRRFDFMGGLIDEVDISSVFYPNDFEIHGPRGLVAISSINDIISLFSWEDPNYIHQIGHPGLLVDLRFDKNGEWLYHDVNEDLYRTHTEDYRSEIFLTKPRLRVFTIDGGLTTSNSADWYEFDETVKVYPNPSFEVIHVKAGKLHRGY